LGFEIPGSGAVQAVRYSSVGTAGEAVQKVVATELNPDFPPMFDSALFSGSGIVKDGGI
jgi:hypothetical protein